MVKNKNNTYSFLYFLIVIAIGGCSLFGGGASKKNPRGQLVGTTDREGFEMSSQYGMVYVPTGRFYMGPADENIQADQSNFNRQVTISAFYMDDTEITNDEYRQFLEEKMHEEVSEFMDEPSIEEAADIYEVFLSIIKNWGFDLNKVLEKADAKREERGSFDERVILINVGDSKPISRGSRYSKQIFIKPDGN